MIMKILRGTENKSTKLILLEQAYPTNLLCWNNRILALVLTLLALLRTSSSFSNPHYSFQKLHQRHLWMPRARRVFLLGRPTTTTNQLSRAPYQISSSLIPLYCSNNAWNSKASAYSVCTLPHQNHRASSGVSSITTSRHHHHQRQTYNRRLFMSGKSLEAASPETENTPNTVDSTDTETFEISNNFSLEELHKRLQEFVDFPFHPGFVLAVAGGGGHLLSSLSSTPGASQVLLQASILYDRESYRRYIQKATDISLEEIPSFRYASIEASKYAATASLKEALEISAAANTTYGHEALHNIRRAVGVGIASALKSPHSKSKSSRAFVTAETSTGQVWTLSAQLAKSKRTRVEEDIAVAHIALTLLECVQTNTCPIPLGEQKSTKAGDLWEIRRLKPDYVDDSEITKESIREGVERILNDGEESIMLLPFQTPSGVAFRCIRRTVLPPHSIVFPGSFNPVHEGHVELAKAAMEKTESKMAFFEISITNADKPALSLDAVVERLQKFLKLPLLHKEENASILSHCRWGLLLTNAPLFKQKVDILQPLHVSRTDNKPKPLPFVIGTDTLVRLVDPKYYNNSYEQMVAALEGMACDFVVGGRLEQKKTDDGTEPVFISGEAEIQELPDSIRPKFTTLDNFRVDISSSEIRRQKSTEQD